MCIRDRLIGSLIMGSFTVISVYGKNDELDTTLLEEHAGGLLDYTKDVYKRQICY